MRADTPVVSEMTDVGVAWATKLEGRKSGPTETRQRLAGPTHSLATSERG